MSGASVPKTAEPAVTAKQIGEAYLQLVHRMRRVADERLAGSGLSLPRVKLMQYLALSGPTRQNVIATCFDVAPRSVTDMVDCLERGGLAVRHDDPSDRRAKLVSLTPAGIDAAASAGLERDQVFEQIFGSLDADSRSTFLAILTTLDRATANAGEVTPGDRAAVDA
jgi:DNA-binding MarR family transcriptional regulator